MNCVVSQNLVASLSMDFDFTDFFYYVSDFDVYVFLISLS